MTSLELRAKRMQVVELMRDLHSRAAKGKDSTDYPADYEAQFQKMKTDLRNYDAMIETAELLAAEEARSAKPVGEQEKTVDVEAAFSRYLRHTKANQVFTAKDAEVLHTRGTSTQVVGTDNLGGYFVPDAWASELMRYTKAFGGILDAGITIETTSKGNTLYMPYVDDTANEGAIITETTADAVSDITAAQKQLGAFVFTSKIVKMSYELLQDDGYNLNGKLQSILGERLGRAVNKKLTIGAGTTEPWGIVTRAANSSITTAALTRANIVNLIHTVDATYREKGKLMFNDNTLSTIIKLSFGASDDRPLWVPSMRDGAPSTIEGYRYVINHNMADQAAAAKFMLFGDMSQYVARMVKGITLESSWEKYFGERVVGYLAYMRLDGDLVGNVNAIKYLAGA